MARILIVEDDATLRMGLEDAIRGEGHEVVVAAEAGAAEECLYQRHVDLVLLDLMLPGKSGLEILRDARERGLMTPILLLTAKSSEQDKVLGLELGADDYVTKPFGLRELLTRVKVLLRREDRLASMLAEKSEKVTQFRIGEVEIDVANLRIRRDQEEEPMTPKEGAMLRLLHDAGGNLVRRDEFLREVWGGGGHVTTRTVDTHILNLRRKIEPDPKDPRYLVTVHGAGYRLDLN